MVLYKDDFVRRNLSKLSSYAFTRLRNNPGYVLCMHLHSLGGKAPYTKGQIKDDIDSWVKGTLPDLEKRVIDQVSATLSSWMPDPSATLSFKQFCNDPMRWGTSGGAPVGRNTRYKQRTKWAWAFDRIITEDGMYNEDADLYLESLKESDVYTVALKEEATKTREVIGTPMSSYLRQCYLLYKFSKIPINSPISNNSCLSGLLYSGAPWYGSVDGDRFDHTIPLSVVISVIDALGKADSETRAVADAEIDSLKSSTIVWNNYSWPLEHGLLSGWRLTSVIGSIVSDSIGAVISTDQKKYNERISLGDDLMLYGYNPISAETMAGLYNQSGLTSNVNKTISGNIGEFLRKVHSPDYVMGYPARGLKSMMYSNPWLENFAYSGPVEAARNLNTFYSRILPHCVTMKSFNSWFINFSKMLFYQQFSWPPDVARGFMEVPVPLGGGATIEQIRWPIRRIIERKVAQPRTRSRDALMAFFGVSEAQEKTHYHIPLVKKISDDILLSAVKLRLSGTNTLNIKISKSINITAQILRWWFDDAATPISLIKNLKIPIPRQLRFPDKYLILDYVLGVSDNKIGVTSLRTDDVMIQQKTSWLSNITFKTTNRRSSTVRTGLSYTLAAMITCMVLLQRQPLPYVTW